jgi:MoaA/NifB/PqqE/SkfB family radical SAM enzyme
MGRTKVWGYPFEWEIDTTNICQLKCPLCHTGLDTVHREKGVMSFDVFKDTIDQIKNHCVWLSLYNWGEPFLNKDIDKYVAYAHKANIATMMSSNLNKPLTPQMAEDIIRSGLDVLIISLDGTTQDVYEIYRVGGHLNRVLDNIKLLVDKRREMGSKTPYFEWQFIVMRQNEAQIPEAKRIGTELGVDNIVFKRVDFPHGEENTELARQWLPVGEGWNHRENPFEKPYQENGDRCWRLWRSAVVNWDGGYAPCCYLTDAADDFGDVKTHSVKEIWNNEHYQAARKLFGKGPMPKQQVGCLTCSVYLESKAAKNRGPIIPLSPNGHHPRESMPAGVVQEANVTNEVGDG